MWLSAGTGAVEGRQGEALGQPKSSFNLGVQKPLSHLTAPRSCINAFYMMLYWNEAIPRSFWAAYSWAVSQGALLTLWLAFAAIVWEAFFDLPRLWRSQSGKEVRARNVIAEVAVRLAGIAGTAAVFVVISFLWFLANDPHEQISKLTKDYDIRLSTANDKINSLESQINLLDAKLTSRDAKGVFVECNVGQPPRVFPTSGMLHVIYVFKEDQNVILSENFGPPGNSMPKFNPLNAVQCIMTNYSQDVLLSVDTGLIIDFLETKKTDNGYAANGTVTSSKRVGGTIDRIDTGSERAFTFYIVNLGEAYVAVRFLDKAGTRHLEAPERVLIPLSYASGQISIPPKFADTQ